MRRREDMPQWNWDPWRRRCWGRNGRRATKKGGIGQGTWKERIGQKGHWENWTWCAKVKGSKGMARQDGKEDGRSNGTLPARSRKEKGKEEEKSASIVEAKVTMPETARRAKEKEAVMAKEWERKEEAKEEQRV